jgi:hypothetical protein
MWRVIAVGFASLLASQAGSAASLDPKLDDVCTPSPVAPASRSRIDTHKLVGFLLKSQGIHDLDLDPKGNDVTFEAKVRAVTNFNTFCSGNGCSIDTTAKLSGAASALIDFLVRSSRPVPPGQSGFDVHPPVGDELNSKRLEAFLIKGETYQVACLAGPQKVATTTPGEVQQQAKKLLSGVVVRNKIDDLRIASTDKKFDSLDSATLSFNDDYIKRTRTVAAKAVIGYQFENSPFGDYSNLIPYMAFENKSVRADNPKDIQNIGNIGGGVLADFNPRIFGYYQNINLFANFLHSYVTDTDLLTGNIVITPDFMFPGVGIAYNPSDGPVSFLLKPQAKALYGTVINAGTDPNLAAKSDYARAGGRVELWIFGEKEPFKLFSFNSAYEYLDVLRGPFGAIWRFENTLHYTFPGQENWSLQLSYVDGRNLDTLNREKQITLGVGYKQ